MAQLRGGHKWQAALDKMAENLSSGATADIGFLPDKRYPDGKLVAMVAAIQEYGAPSRGIPPRPFFRQMVAEQSPTWPRAVAQLLKNTDYNAEKTLDQMGALIKGELQRKINTFEGTPLAPSTIARKGFAKELIDSSVMINSCDYVVKPGSLDE